MSHPLSLSQTALDLQVSKSKLYSLIKQVGVIPANHGNKKLVSSDDIERMRLVLQEEGHQQSLFKNSRSQSKINSESVSPQENPHVVALIAEKDKTIHRLEKQLDAANSKNDRFVESIVGLQQQMNQLNQKLLLSESTESPSPEYKEVIVEERNTPEEGVLVEDLPPEVISKPSRNYVSTTVWLILLGVAVISAFEFGGGSASELLRGWLAAN
jgi:hypothetical protein